MTSSLFSRKWEGEHWNGGGNEADMGRKGTSGYEENPGKTQKTLAICGENGYN